MVLGLLPSELEGNIGLNQVKLTYSTVPNFKNSNFIYFNLIVALYCDG